MPEILLRRFETLQESMIHPFLIFSKNGRSFSQKSRLTTVLKDSEVIATKTNELQGVYPETTIVSQPPVGDAQGSVGNPKDIVSIVGRSSYLGLKTNSSSSE